MKILIFTLLSLCLALTCGVFVPPRHGHKKQQMLGQKECTYGPAYWCKSLTNAGDCHATKHCIQTVWIHQQYPEDTTSICDICKEMVKEARDQLESNETQELIKEVFEGSCALLRIKPIVKECDVIADDYIPDLIDTLASEMNPQTVCAVSGLCNSPRIKQLLAEAGEQVSVKPSEVATRNRCDDCNTVLDTVVTKFKTISKNDFLESLLEVCGTFGSFSDSCSNIVIKYFSDIYSFLQDNFNAGDFCLLSGECYANFHKHNVEITPMSKIGYVQVADQKDDLPCELCEQLVTHLREILVANTTAAEFKLVLEGLCKQTKSFKDECLSIVDEYWNMIYDALVNDLNATTTCQLINICPKNVMSRPLIAPLLPIETAEVATKLNHQPEHVYIPKDDIVVKVMQSKPEMPILSAQDMQLPIDLLVPPHQQVYNEQVCVFCEYFLHYLQKAITDPRVEDEVKKVIDEACSKLPKSVNETCVEFVNTYEPALIAILSQEIDPSQICPMVKACPKENVKDVEIFMHTESSGSCPLCLYAVTELENMIKGDKTKAKIEEALSKVCNRLPGKLRPECTDFVNTYTNELIDALIADLKPQEICVYLKQCTDNTPVSEVLFKDDDFFGGDTETNVIFDDTVNGHPVDDFGDEKCVLCEFIMKEVDDQLKDKKTDDEIKKVVHDICKVLPGTIKDQCNQFVNQYADAVIILLQEAMEPGSICGYLGFCKKAQPPLSFLREEVSKCGVCRSAAEILKTILSNPKVDQNMNHIFEKTCRGMPSDSKETCITTFFKNGALDYVNMIKVFTLIDERSIIPYNNSYNGKAMDCFVCKMIVVSVKSMISLDNVTLQEVERLLDTVCQKIPIIFRGTCHDYIHKYYNLFAQLIITMADEGKICTTLGACEKKNVDDDVEVIGVNETILSSAKCQQCKMVAFLLKTLVVSNTAMIESIKKGIVETCHRMNPNSKFMCNFVLDTAFDYVINDLKSLDPNVACKYIGMCPNTIELQSTIIEKDLCTSCKLISSIVRSVLVDSTVLDMIKEEMTKICNKLPNPIKDICNTQLQEHWKDLVNTLKNFNTEQFCKKTRMCASLQELSKNVDDKGEKCKECIKVANMLKNLVLKNPAKVQKIKEHILGSCQGMPSDAKYVCTFILESGFDFVISNIKSLDPNVACKYTGMCSTRIELRTTNIERDICTPCKLLSSIVRSVLDDPSILSMVKEGMTKTCNKLPDAIKNMCNSELQTHWKDFVNALKHFNSEQFCKQAKMCAVWDEVLKNVNNNEKCNECIKVANMLKNLVLKNPAKIQKIKKEILGASHGLPSEAKYVCDFILESGFDFVISNIKSLDPNVACKYAGMCSNRIELQTTNIERDICTPCKLLSSIVRSVLDDPSILSMVKEEVTKTCNKLPDPIKNMCNSELQAHWKDLLNALKHFNSEQFCKQAKMCAVWDQVLKNVNNNEKCNECIKVANMLKNLVLKNPAKIQKIKKEILGACHELPSEAKYVCDFILESGFDFVISNIKSLDPNVACKYAGMCSNRIELQTTNIERDICTPCKLLSSVARSVLNDPSILSMVKEGMTKTCNKLPDPIKNMCNSELQAHWKDLVNALGNFNSEQFCKKAKMCAVRDELLKNVNQYEKCKECIKVANMLKRFVVIHPFMVRIIKNKILRSCQRMTADEKYVCNFILGSSFDYVISNIKSLDPNFACKYAKMCPNRIDLQATDIEKCEECKSIAHKLKTIMSKNPTIIKTIKKEIMEICYRVVPEGEMICDIVVESYWDYLVGLVLGSDPGLVCKYVGICSNRIVLQTTDIGDTIYMSEGQGPMV